MATPSIPDPPPCPSRSQSWDDVAGVLDQLVEVGELLSLLKLLEEVLLQVLELITDPHVWRLLGNTPLTGCEVTATGSSEL